MNGRNQPPVTDEQAEFEKSPVQIEDFEKLTNPFRRIYRTFRESNQQKNNQKMSTM
jgi:hypothetical protein